jgi:hypothetical protein
MVLIKSPKGIWRNHPPEWLEFDPKQITPASLEEALASFEIYIQRIEKMLEDVKTMRHEWQKTILTEKQLS